MPAIWTTVAVLPYAAILVYYLFHEEYRERILLPGLIILLFTCLILEQRLHLFNLIWWSASYIVPIVALLGCLFLAKMSQSESVPVKRRLETFLLVSMSSMVALIQYPFSVAIYFCYIAPLVILALVFLVGARPDLPKRTHGAVLIFYLLFAVLRMHPVLRQYYQRVGQSGPLNIERAGLIVYDYEKGVYEELVKQIRSHAFSGAPIFATPDCPQVYFLAGMRNPTRVLFDFYDDPKGRTDRIVQLLEEASVKVVVINRRPAFSPPIDPRLEALLQTRFPAEKQIEWFTLRWRE
jgi:hypothetical protein